MWSSFGSFGFPPLVWSFSVLSQNSSRVAQSLLQRPTCSLTCSIFSQTANGGFYWRHTNQWCTTRMMYWLELSTDTFCRYCTLHYLWQVFCKIGRIILCWAFLDGRLFGTETPTNYVYRWFHWRHINKWCTTRMMYWVALSTDTFCRCCTLHYLWQVFCKIGRIILCWAFRDGRLLGTETPANCVYRSLKKPIRHFIMLTWWSGLPVMMMAFSSHAKILGEDSMNHFQPARLFLSFFFRPAGVQQDHAFGQGYVNSGLVS